jgi:hypothetical protein
MSQSEYALANVSPQTKDRFSSLEACAIRSRSDI